MSRYLYTFCFYLGLPIMFVRLLWRSLKNPDYRLRWKERLGIYGKPFQSNRRQSIVIHAVSVGEVHAAVPLIRVLQRSEPETRIIVTTSTPTGSARVSALLKDSVDHVYLPYDLPGAVQRFLNQYKPAALVLMETELWPNLIHYTSQAEVPVLLINARLSEKSRKGYSRLGSLLKSMLLQISWTGAQSSDDKQRFLSLGMPPDRIDVCGSLKFDIQVPHDQVEAGSQLHQRLFPGRPVVIAASTREGEDEKVISAFRNLLERIPEAGLILVPRHLERFELAEALAKKAGLKVCKKSELKEKGFKEGVTECSDLQVLVGDTLGELFQYYSAADVAFVGGSLVPTGCQNILEPAALGLPIITGSSRFNFQSISDAMIKAGALKEVQNQQELGLVWNELLSNKELALTMGQAAKKEFSRNSGASQTILARIQSYLHLTPE